MPGNSPHPAKKRHCLQKVARKEQVGALNARVALPKVQLVVPNEQRWGNGFAEGPGRERLNILLAEVERVAADAGRVGG